MACEKSNSTSDNNSRQFCGFHLSNDVAANASMFSNWATSSHEVKSRSVPLDDAQQLEEYVNELVPALHMVNKSTHNMHIAHRQEAIRCTADALLVRRATGMAWSDALGKRLSTFCTEASHHQGVVGSLHPEEISTEGPDYMTRPNVECASSSCIRTAVSSDGTNSCDFSDQEFSAQHHESTASLASSDNSSMVDSTSELLQDDINALTNVQSRVSLPLMNILSSSDAHMGSVNSSGELLSMYKQGVNQLKSESQLHEEINARLGENRCCYEEREMHEGRQQSCNGSNISSHSCSKAYATQCNICNDTSAGGKDYPFMKIPGHDRVEKKGIHEVHHDMPCQHADVAQFEQEYYNDLASIYQNPRVDVQTGHTVFRQLASYENDVAQNLVHEVTGLKGMQLNDTAALDDVVVLPGEVAELEAKSEGDVDRGRMTWQGSSSTTKDDVADEVANGGGELGGQQALTWQETIYLQSTDDVAGNVGYAAEVDAGVVRRGSYGSNHKMREMMYGMAAYQPINWNSIMEEVVGKEMPKRRNVRISKEPQSVAARRRRERISERIRILQRLVPGTSKLDTASMLDEAIHYLKFLKLQVQALRRIDKVFTCLPAFSMATSQCPGSQICPLSPFNSYSLPSSSVAHPNLAPLFQS